MDHFSHIIIIINIYIILAVSTNLLVGMTNLLSIGQAAFYGLGAYLAVFALMFLKLTLIPAIVFVMIGTGLLSVAVAYPSLRLKGDYFVLATLGFQMIVYTLLNNWIDVTGGPRGISGIPSPMLFGKFEISGKVPFLLLSLVLAAFLVYISYKIMHSPYGRVLKGIREDELAVSSLGRSVTSFKIWVFVISSAFIGIAGMIYATYVSFIDPTSFNLNEAIFILAAVLIGGTGSNIRGPVLGAVFVVLLPEIIRLIGFPDSVAANLRQIVYGLLLIILMRYRPKGLAGDHYIR